MKRSAPLLLIAAAALSGCSDNSTDRGDTVADHIAGGTVDAIKICQDTAEKNQGEIVWNDAESTTAPLPDGNSAVLVVGKPPVPNGTHYVVSCTISPAGEVVDINDDPTPHPDGYQPPSSEPNAADSEEPTFVRCLDQGYPGPAEYSDGSIRVAEQCKVDGATDTRPEGA